jgi:hypothetical protein
MVQLAPVAVAERAAVRAAMLAFCQTTLPPLAVAADKAVLAVDPMQSAIAADPDAGLYAAAKLYMDRMIALGLSAGPNPLPVR